jgi:hypothetical protein
MLFVVENKNLFILNSENHTKNTRQSNNFYQPITNYTYYVPRGVYYMGIEVFNNLPSYIKEASNNDRKFEINLKHFLYAFFLLHRKIFSI